MAARLCACGSSLLEDGLHPVCPACRRPVRCWLVRDAEGVLVGAGDAERIYMPKELVVALGVPPSLLSR